MFSHVLCGSLAYLCFMGASSDPRPLAGMVAIIWVKSFFNYFKIASLRVGHLAGAL